MSAVRQSGGTHGRPGTGNHLWRASSFLLQARAGINLADEGFLWYGVQQTAHGQVAIRDFQSYDPGRYYWGAAGAFLFGKGLLALRFSETIFQIIGLWAGLMAATRIARTWVMLVAIGFMLTIWMFPSHKLFDHTLLLCGIWFATRIDRRTFLAQNFRGRLVYRPVRLLRKKSRSLQFPRARVSAVARLF